ncbi:MAG: hypothetical protein HYY24_13105 [Verrucomicrobia bacterium]|nr:hypothetical protein [Verrucomicrobiota bacterium]
MAAVLHTVEATVEPSGEVHLLKPLKLGKPAKAIVTVLVEEADAWTLEEMALLSEPSLAEDWSRPEEDSAWSHLQPDR